MGGPNVANVFKIRCNVLSFVDAMVIVVKRGLYFILEFFHILRLLC